MYCYLLLLLPCAHMHSRGKTMPSCLWCVCPQKNIEKYFKQGHKGVYRCHSQWKTISITILGRFCTWYKSRRFFTPLFQLLPIIGFVAPPLLKSHVVVTVCNATRTPIRENTGGIDLATYGETRGVIIPWIHSSLHKHWCSSVFSLTWPCSTALLLSCGMLYQCLHLPHLLFYLIPRKTLKWYCCE